MQSAAGHALGNTDNTLSECALPTSLPSGDSAPPPDRKVHGFIRRRGELRRRALQFSYCRLQTV